MVFKKDLTPFAKGGSVTKQRGKGSKEHRPDAMAQITNRYPKPAPASPVPRNAGMTPPFGIGVPPEEV
jgi:hypothetical protein